MTGSQWTSAVVIVLCLVGLFLVRRTPRFFQWDRSHTRTGVPSEGPDQPDEAEPASVGPSLGTETKTNSGALGFEASPEE
jgi:hypothetical protein